MSKNPRNPGWSVRSIAICALLTALSVILAKGRSLGFASTATDSTPSSDSLSLRLQVS